MNRLGWTAGALAILFLLLIPSGDRAAADQEIYTVILNGRAMDPESGPDQIARVGIRGEKIAVISMEKADF